MMEMNNGGIGLMVSDELKEELKQQQQYYSQPKSSKCITVRRRWYYQTRKPRISSYK